MIRPALRRGLAKKAVARRGVSIALACRTFDVSETCYRYSPLLSDENEEIADRLRAAGKPHTVVITAVARKLVTIANALCKSRQNWSDPAS